MYKVIDRYQKNWQKRFQTEAECRKWVMDGLRGCDGAEREHYADMLVELEDGKTVLHYN